MRSLMRKSVMLAGACLVVGAASANAAVSNIVEVKIPFPFVVNHQTLAPGQYRLEREESVLMIRGGKGNHTAAAIAMTMPVGGQDPGGSMPALSFTRFENQYRLSRVWESAREGFDVINR